MQTTEKTNESTQEISRMENDFVKNFSASEEKYKKYGLGDKTKYLPWAIAWTAFREIYPNGTYRIKEYENIRQIKVVDPATGEVQTKYIKEKNLYKNDPLGLYCSVEVSLDGVHYENEQILPIMQHMSNKCMKTEPYTYLTKNGTKTVEAASMNDINRSIFRCLVKAIAIYTGIGLSFWVKDEQNFELDVPVTEEMASSMEERIEMWKLSCRSLLTQVNNKFGKKYKKISEMNQREYAWMEASIDAYEKEMRLKALKTKMNALGQDLLASINAVYHATFSGYEDVTLDMVEYMESYVERCKKEGSGMEKGHRAKKGVEKETEQKGKLKKAEKDDTDLKDPVNDQKEAKDEAISGKKEEKKDELIRRAASMQVTPEKLLTVVNKAYQTQFQSLDDLTEEQMQYLDKCLDKQAEGLAKKKEEKDVVTSDASFDLPDFMKAVG